MQSLGRHNLIQNNGTLMPVVWGNYVPNVQAYQGRVDDKRRVLELFLKDTQVPNPNIDYTIRYPELILLWEHIFFYIKSRRASLLETYSSE